MITAILSAASLGLLTAISPCPLATNIATLTFIGRHSKSPRRSLIAGLFYVAGRTIAYVALAALLTAGLLAAVTASKAGSRYLVLLIGPVLVISGGMILGLIPAPRFGVASAQFSERLGRRGDTIGAFALGIVFALSFCPVSAALFFGSLVPLAARAESPWMVPVAYGLATGLPVVAFGLLIAAGGNRLGRVYGGVQRVERWMRVGTGLVLLGVGISFCLSSNWGLW
ncbi:MAG TPA: aromatic aminobenezylarsenical efflux permease ArsG family transporter [Planctomycetota bacterium]|nr:aromatic aminobenezylarsenical efflux permease ArsG family transporter [Planctomycetota bacterium]